jgi:hypothetical protein
MTNREEPTVTFPLDTCDQTPASDVRELAHRSGDGLDVTLVWYPAPNQVGVRVADARSGEHFELRVDPAAALDAFEHPFAYAPAPARETAGAHRSLATA